MSYVGEPISKSNKPSNWKEQFSIILEDLKKEGIQHNDIKLQEVLIKDGKVHLTDYGWASLGNDWSVGGLFDPRPKPHADRFPDSNAINLISSRIGA